MENRVVDTVVLYSLWKKYKRQNATLSCMDSTVVKNNNKIHTMYANILAHQTPSKLTFIFVALLIAGQIVQLGVTRIFSIVL